MPWVMVSFDLEDGQGQRVQPGKAVFSALDGRGLFRYRKREGEVQYPDNTVAGESTMLGDTARDICAALEKVIETAAAGPLVAHLTVAVVPKPEDIVPFCRYPRKKN